MLEAANHHVITDHFILPVEEIFDKKYSTKFAEQIIKNLKDANHEQLNDCLEYIKDTTNSMTTLPSPNKCTQAFDAVTQGYVPVAKRKPTITKGRQALTIVGMKTIDEYYEKIENWNGYPRYVMLDLSNYRDRQSAWDWIAFYNSLTPRLNFTLKFSLRKLNDRAKIQVPTHNPLDFEPTISLSASLDTSKQQDKDLAQKWAKYFEACDFGGIAKEISDKAKAGHQVQVPARNVWPQKIYFA